MSFPHRRNRRSPATALRTCQEAIPPAAVRRSPQLSRRLRPPLPGLPGPLGDGFPPPEPYRVALLCLHLYGSSGSVRPDRWQLHPLRVMTHPAAPQSTVRRLAITVRGVVQGVGFRPFVYNAARSRRLAGWVQNEAGIVRIEVQGTSDALEAFCDTLRGAHPPQARIDSLQVCETACEDGATATFEIRESPAEGTPRPTIPADLATCTECLEEVRSPDERRCRYPFTNCTNCGPRWSIIKKLPYDRPRTSMASFRMCPDCQGEYSNPSDRRFHAQPIACPRCGPSLRLLDSHGRQTASRDEALQQAVSAVLCGQILALKGLGGFQLIVDATNAEAVARLRQRKRRPAKPLALMLASLEEVRKRCEVSDSEARALSSHEAPILLLRRLGDRRVDNHQSSIINHQSSIINHQSSMTWSRALHRGIPTWE